jgi:hypothetical protein
MDIARRRLAAQHLTHPTLTDAAEVVRVLGAVQSQDYAGAKWAIGMRSRGVTDASVERAFNEGRIIRTHVLRPTWHFVDPAAVRWMLALTAPRIKRVMSYYNVQVGLDDPLLRRTNGILERVLRDGKQLTRTELAKVLQSAGVDVSGPFRLARVVMNAELDAVVCSGGRRGNQFTYALLEDRAPPTKPLDRDEALLELSRRYFATRGPVTPNDFAWWSGLTVADARRGIEIMGDELERELIDGRPYWSVPSTVKRWRGPLVHLLPNYDELFIGHKDRSALGDRLASVDLVIGGDALTAYVVVVDGQLVGGWKRAPTAKSVAVDLKLFVPLSAAERRALEGAARRYGAFLESPVVLEGARESATRRPPRSSARSRPTPRRSS